MIYGNVNSGGGFGANPGDLLFGQDFGKLADVDIIAQTNPSNPGQVGRKDLNGWFLNGGRLSDDKWVMYSDDTVQVVDFKQHKRVARYKAVGLLSVEGDVLYRLAREYGADPSRPNDVHYWVEKMEVMTGRVIEKIEFKNFEAEKVYQTQISSVKYGDYLYTTWKSKVNNTEYTFLVKNDLKTGKIVKDKRYDGYKSQVFITSADARGLLIHQGSWIGGDGINKLILDFNTFNTVGTHDVDAMSEATFKPHDGKGNIVDLPNDSFKVGNHTIKWEDGMLKYGDVWEYPTDHVSHLYVDDKGVLYGAFTSYKTKYMSLDYMNYTMPNFDIRPWWDR